MRPPASPTLANVAPLGPLPACAEAANFVRELRLRGGCFHSNSLVLLITNCVSFETMPIVERNVTVRYVRTADGYNLAYVEEGEGTPVVVLPFHFAHVRRRWIFDPGWANALSTQNHVVTYDSRGQGLSTRGLPSPPALADYATDLETVMGEAGLGEAVLVAYGGFAHVALRYALEHPERVPALVLICTCESFSAWPTLSMISMASDHWDLFVDLQNANTPEEYRSLFVSFNKACAQPEDFVHMVRTFADSTVSDLLGEVRVPTLVIHSLDQHWLSPDEAVALAGKIPGAQLVLLDGGTEPNPVLGVRAINDFIAHLGLAARPSPEPAALPQLTERQVQVLHLIAQGRTNREVAAELFLSERTVERHLGDIYGKLGVRNRGEAIAYALRRD